MVNYTLKQLENQGLSLREVCGNKQAHNKIIEAIYFGSQRCNLL
jgi:hypothetical protein